MGVLASLYGADSPQAQFVDANQNWISALAAGLGSPGKLSEKLGAAAQYAGQGKALDQTYNAQLQQTNQLKQYLTRIGRQDLVQLVDAGQAPEALRQAYADAAAAKAAKNASPRTGAINDKLVNLDTGAVLGDYGDPAAPPDPMSTVAGRTALAQQMKLPIDQAQQLIVNGKLPEGPKPASLPTSYQEFQLAKADPEYAKQLNSTTSKPPTEQVRRAQQLASVVNPQFEIASRNFDALADVGDMAKGSNNVTYGMTSTQYQQAKNAVQTIAQSYLYSVSGAAAPAEEVNKLVASVTPQPFESAQSIANKKALLKQMVDSINLMAEGGVAPGAAAPSGGGNTTASGVTWSIE